MNRIGLALLGVILTAATVAHAQLRELAHREYADARHTFRLAIDTTRRNRFSVAEIVVIRRSDGAVVQRIVPDENSAAGLPDDQLFVIEDVNFDGHNDFRLVQFVPAAPNVPFYFWIFEPRTGRFVRDRRLEKITSPMFDPERRIIISSWRASCCDRGESVYRYINGKVVLVEETEAASDDPRHPGFMVLTTKKRVNGKMKLVQRRLEKLEETDRPRGR